MAYATTQDLIDRFGEDEIRAVSDRADPPAGAIDQDVVAKAVSDASEEIDGYLAKRYALPIAGTVPAVLVQLASDIARLRLHRHIPPDDVKDAYTRAVKRLQEIAAGDFILQLDGVEPKQGGINTAEIASPPRVFSSESMKGF